MDLLIQGIPTEEVERFRSGGLDAYGQAPLMRRSDGPRNPCRHCLSLIAEGEPKLVLAYRPFFGTPQPYAETGPIFLHQSACRRYMSATMPRWFAFLDPAAIRGYDGDDWIRYDTGAIVAGATLHDSSVAILRDPTVAYVHIRSKFGCFQCRVDRS